MGLLELVMAILEPIHNGAESVSLTARKVIDKVLNKRSHGAGFQQVSGVQPATQQ